MLAKYGLVIMEKKVLKPFTLDTQASQNLILFFFFFYSATLLVTNEPKFSEK